MAKAKTLTPVLRKEKESVTMDFPEAIRRIINGRKVRRISWPSEDYALLRTGWLSIFTKGDFHTWTVNDGDLEGNDWIVIIEGN